MLTGDYMPEYGRVSGGQIRMVTKGGSNRFSGSGGYYLRDDKLQANTWTRNHSSNLSDRVAAPFNYKQYAYSIGGPVLKDKLFFFAAQEWVNFLQTQTNTATVGRADQFDPNTANDSASATKRNCTRSFMPNTTRSTPFTRSGSCG